MRWGWLAALLAGCGVAAPAATKSPGCGGAASPSRLSAIHFLSPQVGVGLTSPSARCGPMLALTRDGGRRWVTEGVPLPRPPAGIFIEQLEATSPRTAWVASGTGPLMATTNGGSTWTVQPVPGPVVGLAITRQTLWALGCPHRINVQCGPVLARKLLPTGSRWRLIPVPGFHSVPAPELAVPDPSTVVVNAGPSDGGSRLAISVDGGGRWRFSAPAWMGQPCDGGDLTTAGPADWWLICLGGAAAGSSAKALLHTTDGGRTWRIASQVTSVIPPEPPGAITTAEPNALAAGSRTRLWLAGWNSMTQSDDGGSTWIDVPGVNPQGMPAAFDVLSPTDAWLLAAGRGLWRTTDGRHWREL